MSGLVLLDVDENTQEQVALGSFVALTAVTICVVFDVLIKKYRILWLPESVASMALGGLIGIVDALLFRSSGRDVIEGLQDSFFFILLPPIIFEAGYSLKRKRFFINMGSILLFAIFGTLVSAIVMGFGFQLFAYLNVIPKPSNPYDYFAFAALMSATDPVATLSIFSSPSVDAPPRLHSLVFGESLLNDAIAIVLFETFVNFQNHKVNVGYGGEIGIFMAIFIGSMAIGAVFALLLSFITKRVNFVELASSPHYEMLLILVVSFANYFLAQFVGLSGIIALFFCGVVLAHYNRYNITPESHEASHMVAKTLSQLCETTIFLILGYVAGSTIVRPPPGERWNFSMIGVTLLLCLVSRAVHVFPFSLLLNKAFNKRIPFRMQCVSTCSHQILLVLFMLIYWDAVMGFILAVSLVCRSSWRHRVRA
jgi:sodium/hydrogen exchanger 8